MKFLIVCLVQASQDPIGKVGCDKDGESRGKVHHNAEPAPAHYLFAIGNQWRGGSKGAVGDQGIVGDLPLLAFEKPDFLGRMVEGC
jgi:hypothetical protein